jgi:hypothetical protein
MKALPIVLNRLIENNSALKDWLDFLTMYVQIRIKLSRNIASHCPLTIKQRGSTSWMKLRPKIKT